MSTLLVPLIVVCIAAWALYKRVDIFSAMCAGAKDGLKTAFGILPSLCVLLPVVYMLRASALPEALAGLLAPLLDILGIPGETAALMLLRPVSGSGALAIGSDIMSTYGADSYIGRVASVMLGSTETSLYVIAVYFGSLGIKNTRHAVPAALVADIAGFIMAALSVRLVFG